MMQLTKNDTTDDRYYEGVDQNGKHWKFISVTTVLNSILAKPALVPWAFNVGVENTLEIIQGDAERCIKEDRADEFIIAAANADVGYMKNRLKAREMTTKDNSGLAAQRGTNIHTILENMIKLDMEKNCNQFSSEVQPYVNNINKFIDEYGPEWHESELTVFSLDKLYAGTLDAVCTITKHPKRRRHESLVGKRVLLDLKTNKSAAIYPKIHYPQLTAYGNAYKEMGDQYDKSVILAVGPDKFSIGVNNYPDNSFDVVHEVFKMYESTKKK